MNEKSAACRQEAQEAQGFKLSGGLPWAAQYDIMSVK